jgi:hypothetical protein
MAAQEVDEGAVQKSYVQAPQWLSNLTENPIVATLSAGLAAALLSGLEVISLARFDFETALGILQASGTGVVLVGTAMSLFPGIALTIASGCTALIMLYDLRARTHFALWLTMGFSASVTILTIPLIYYPVVLAGLMLLVLARLRRESVIGFLNRKRVAAAVALLSALVLVVGAVKGIAWSPHEDFVIKGRGQITGYLLSQTDITTVILRNAPREIEYHPTSELVSQYACDDAPWYWHPITALLPTYGSPYRPCQRHSVNILPFP